MFYMLEKERNTLICALDPIYHARHLLKRPTCVLHLKTLKLLCLKIGEPSSRIFIYLLNAVYNVLLFILFKK